MRRRICLVAALCVIPLASGVAASAAKTKTKTKSTKAKPTTVYCRTAVGLMIPAGQTEITPPASQGDEWGTASCGKLGKGAQGDNFTVVDSGDSVGKFTWYLSTGTVSGTFDLTPQEGSLGSGFASVTYLGTLKVTGATGTLVGVKGTGTMNCSSPDSIHTSCTDKLKLTDKTGTL